MLKKFWNDESGFVVTVEMILVATVLVIGLVAGLTMLRDAVLSELGDTAAAFGGIDQTYGISGTNYAGTEAATSVMGFTDAPDAGDDTSAAGVSLVAAASGIDVIAVSPANVTGTDQKNQ